MNKNALQIDSLPAACDVMLAALAAHPERDELAAVTAALAGARRDYPCVFIQHLFDPADTEPCRDDVVLPDVTADKATPDGALAHEVIGMLEPLKMLNPISAAFGLGLGPGTLVASFGIPLNPEAQNAPSFTRSLADVMAEPPPDPAASGLLAGMHQRIAQIRALTPPTFLIRLPDYQGPFNIAHSVLGSEVFTAPYDTPDLFAAFLSRVTELLLAARRNMIDWIGPERLHPLDRIGHISNCSVNLVSADFYREFLLAQDQRIAAACGDLHMHPCSGPHVFYVTLENLPLCVAEAGHIERTAAGSISVDDASRAIGDRPILLMIAQELPEGQEFEFIKADLDRYAATPRLMFSYTGMHWRRRDRARIRDIHRRLDAHWDARLRHPCASV
jgi:hypothetical protein